MEPKVVSIVPKVWGKGATFRLPKTDYPRVNLRDPTVVAGGSFDNNDYWTA